MTGQGVTVTLRPRITQVARARSDRPQFQEVTQINVANRLIS
jgi:hypothetical protein